MLKDKFYTDLSFCTVSLLPLGTWMPWAVKVKLCTPHGREAECLQNTSSVETSKVQELRSSFIRTTPGKGNLPTPPLRLHRSFPVVLVCVCARARTCMWFVLPSLRMKQKGWGLGRGKHCLRNQPHAAERTVVLQLVLKIGFGAKK